MTFRETFELADGHGGNDQGPLPLLEGVLAALVPRYGLTPVICVRRADGSLRPGARPTRMDDLRLGTIVSPRAGDGSPIVAIEATLAPGSRTPVTVVFTAQRRDDRHAITMEACGDDGRTVDVRFIPGHIRRVVQAAVEHPDVLFGALDILSDEERRLLLDTFNGRQVTYPPFTLHGMFAAQVSRTPDAVALIDGERRMTYEALHAASNRVAHHLRPHVSRPGQVVAVIGERTLETLIVKLAVMKAGGAFMYVSAGTPAARSALMCSIASPVAIVRSRAVSVVPAAGTQLILEDLVERAGQTRPLDEVADATTAAYVLFTSGSTGQPKGVVRPHRMNTTRILLEQRLYALDGTDRHLMKSVPFFREYYWALATGGTLIVARPRGERDDAYLVRLIREQQISICSFVPSMLRVLLANRAFSEPGLPIRHLFVAGEVLDPELEARLRDLGLAVHVTYTLAEADYVSHRSGPAADARTAIDVGRSIDMRMYICDEAGRLRPPGAIGEIWTGGPGLADGYVNRPDLTAERFVANPFDPEHAPTLFRTGDLARFGAEGQVEFVGRADSQVKVRGQRVEPTEVELAIRGHAQIHDVAIATVVDPDQGHQLVAYVVPISGNVDVASLRSYLHERVPEYMVPAYIVHVPQLPLLESGKADRIGLRSIQAVRPTTLADASEPENEVQSRIVGVWRKVLGMQDIGIDDTFVDLGGDSLKTMLLRIALETELGVPVTLAQLIEAATVRDFADQLRVES